MKEQQNPPEEELNEREASNLSDIEFREMIIRILSSMNKDIEIIKKDQWEIKNSISEINKTLEGINSMLDEAEDWISDLEDKVEKVPKQSSKKKKKFFWWEECKKSLGNHEA